MFTRGMDQRLSQSKSRSVSMRNVASTEIIPRFVRCSLLFCGCFALLLLFCKRDSPETRGFDDCPLYNPWGELRSVSSHPIPSPSLPSPSPPPFHSRHTLMCASLSRMFIPWRPPADFRVRYEMRSRRASACFRAASFVIRRNLLISVRLLVIGLIFRRLTGTPPVVCAAEER